MSMQTDEPQVRTSSREGVLARDGARCVVTKAIPIDKAAETDTATETLKGDLEVAHIIPLSFLSQDSEVQP